MFNLMVFLAGSQSNPGLTILLIVFGFILFLAAIIAVAHIRVVSQTNAYVVERLGRHHKTWGTGVHFLVPFIDRIAEDKTSPVSVYGQKNKIYQGQSHKIGIVNLKEQVIDFDPQPVITKDNVTMQIDTVIYYQITDPKLYVYGVSNPIGALDNLTATTIRNIMGDLDLDEALTSRELVNTKMRAILDEATDPWGIKVFRVEVKNIMPPKDIRDAMEKQMRAERERREAILLAEGEKRSNILRAEGIKESEILKAEAHKEALIREAEGKAKSIIIVNQATAEGLEMIKKVQVDKGVLTLKAYEALGVVANGQATKIVIPSELQSIAGLALTAKEVFTDEKINK